jgi:hypothetical protein
MCRYGGGGYLTHWACVPCRRSRKAPSYCRQACHTCHRPMVDMGRDFHAPRRGAEAQWRKLAVLVQAGLLFHSCGCAGPGPRPRTLADANTQLALRRVHRRRYAPPARDRGRRPLEVI